MANLKKSAPARKVSRCSVTDEQRNNYVEVAAYYIAERRGFYGDSKEDWKQAELEINRLLSEGRLNH